MDKINKEINNISNITNSKFQALNGSESTGNNTINNQIHNNYETNHNEISSKTELETNNRNVCDHNCRCDSCNAKPQDNTTNHTNNKNNFAEYQTVSFKNPEQLDIVVEKDNKQACCLIYNNNCIIF